MGFIKKNNLKEVLNESDEAVERALTIIGMQCENYARLNCPVDTGLLRNSITSAIGGGDTTVKTYHASKGSNRTKNGNRVSATSKNAGAVGFGSYNAKPPKEATPYVVIGSNVEYAPYQELGTSKQMACNRGKGFLRPAITNHVQEYERIAKAELKK